MYPKSHPAENAPVKRERWAISRLFKPRKSAQIIPSLPVELWMHIISYVLISNWVRYQNVNYANFWFYKEKLLDPWSIEREMQLCERDYTAVRQVCKTWRAMARPGPEIILRSGSEVLPIGIATLLITGGSNVGPFIQRMDEVPNITSHLTTLIISRGWHGGWNGHVDILMSDSNIFPTVRCLSIEEPWNFEIFWVRLQKVFPELVSLTVRKELKADGMLKLKKLEILDMEWADTMVYHCKSLRHCSFHGVFYTHSFVSFLEAHGALLESLILDIRDFQRIDSRFYRQDTFWRYLPHLRTFGLHLGIRSWLWFDIPKNDSLIHLYLTLDRIESSITRITVDQVKDKVRKLSWLRCIGINESAFAENDHATLKRYCGMLGIVYSTLPN